MKVRMPRLHEGQEAVRLSPARFKALACGRRWGKTQLCSVLALACAIQGGIVWWVAPTAEVAQRGWEKCEPLSRRIPGCEIRHSDAEIRFPGGGKIAFRSADGRRSLRGPGVDLLIIDEAAYVPEVVWQADLRPTLSDRSGRALLISTPNGRGDWFHRAYQRGQDPAWASYASWQAPTSANPLIPMGEVAEAQSSLPDWVYRQEYLAEFVTFEGRVYKSLDIDCRHAFDVLDLARYPEYYGGIDFGFRNPTCMVVGGRTRDDVCDIVDGVHESGLTSQDIISECRRLTDMYSVRRWWADPADPGMIEELRRARIPVFPAPRATGDLERSWVKNGIIEVEKRLVSDRLRYHRPLRWWAEAMDGYRYAQGRDGVEEKEAPLKVADHAPDATRYLVVGIHDMHKRTPGVRVL